MGSGLKKKKVGMGDYSPSENECKAYLWGVRNNLRIAPKQASWGNNEWFVEIFLNGKWVHNDEKFGPVEVWEQVYNYYIYYYERRSKM